MAALIDLLIEDAHGRRAKLLSELPENSLVLIEGASLQTRHNDVEYPFYQRSNFWYLCPFDEPNGLLVLHTLNGAQASLLFCQDKTAEQTVWTGASLGSNEAPTRFLLDGAYANDARSKELTTLCNAAQHIYYEINHTSQEITDYVKAAEHTRRTTLQSISDIRHTLHTLRRIKSPTELACIKQAADCSSVAFHHTIVNSTRQKHEYQLAAHFSSQCAAQGNAHLAYPSICASGENACTLHYTNNNQPLQQDEVVLMDAGCEHLRYASDITRSWVPSGTWCSEQRDVYHIVLAAQQAVIDMVKPGIAFNTLQQMALCELTQGLIDLGLLQGTLADALHEKRYQPYYMHGCSHWLGLDVHDPCPYMDDQQQSITLVPGMVFTVEPGLYIRNHPRSAAIGVRIEDDIVVTEDGAQVLTSAPKAIDDLIALCQ